MTDLELALWQGGLLRPLVCLQCSYPAVIFPQVWVGTCVLFLNNNTAKVVGRHSIIMLPKTLPSVFSLTGSYSVSCPVRRSLWQPTKSQQGPEALSLTTCKKLNPSQTMQT